MSSSVSRMSNRILCNWTWGSSSSTVTKLIEVDHVMLCSRTSPVQLPLDSLKLLNLITPPNANITGIMRTYTLRTPLPVPQAPFFRLVLSLLRCFLSLRLVLSFRSLLLSARASWASPLAFSFFSSTSTNQSFSPSLFLPL